MVPLKGRPIKPPSHSNSRWNQNDRPKEPGERNSANHDQPLGTSIIRRISQRAGLVPGVGISAGDWVVSRLGPGFFHEFGALIMLGRTLILSQSLGDFRHTE